MNRGARRASTELARRRALAWHQVYLIRYRYLVWKQQHGAAAIAIILTAFIGLSGFSVPTLQELLHPILATEAELASLASFLLTLGGALI